MISTFVLCHGQTVTESEVRGFAHPLSKIERRLNGGDVLALNDLAKYFDSNKAVVEYLGYHRIETTESMIAKRIAQENCLFTPAEIAFTEATSKKDFLLFLKSNEAKIRFSKDADAFLITPLDVRDVEFETVEISPAKMNELRGKFNDLIKLDWVQREGIDLLIRSRDTEALFKIASHLFQERSRWNRYYFDEENDLNLLEYLTGTQIIVKNEENEFSYHIEADFNPTSKLNLLIFFAKYHKDYKFDNEKQVFINPQISPKSKSDLRVLFETLSSPDNDIALAAFIKLSELEPKKVAKLADEFQSARIDTNRSLPTFPFRFLAQLTLLTDYCRNNGIDYKGTGRVKTIIASLKKQMSISDRYSLENKVIAELSVDEITAFEYWALIYQSEWMLSYSAGRILDKTYGKYWNEIMNDDQQISLYLKKAALFDELGIIGVVNKKYPDKFLDSSQKTLARLTSLKTSDKDVIDQIAKIRELKPSSSYLAKPKNKTVNAPENLETSLLGFAQKGLLNDEQVNELIDILSQISYEQIGIALKYLELIEFEDPSEFRSKYEFLTSDWGFDLVGDFANELIRKEFTKNYSTMSQSQLYAFYLDKNHFDFKNSDGSLDYDKIYEMLKYDVVEAFAGGGGGRREKHIYSLVKLLENEFNTTLGFMNKLCMSRNVYSCSSDGRARKWMTFLEENDHLRLPHNEPPSFTYRERVD